jgi:TetR/AcrR family transcriptional regulator, cholesterol catabolism regulator
MPDTKKKSKKALIQETAAQLFRDKGYSATSMRDLAEAVNLKASSLYNHISSKEEILKNICFENARRFISGMAQVEATDATASEKVRKLLQLHVRTAMEDATSVTAFNDEWRHLNEPFLTEFKALRRDYEQRFLQLLRQGIASGEFRQMEDQVALYTLFSSVRWLYDWFQPGHALSAEQVEAEVVAFVMQGLKR